MEKTDSLQTTNAESLATAKRLYQDSQSRSLAQMLDIMGTQYRMTITPELARFWKQSLIDQNGLSPEQIRQGFLAYMGSSETSGFPPQPGDIVGCAPDTVPDRPRLKIRPDCQMCSGTGWRFVDGKEHKATRERSVGVTRCTCTVVVYEGQEYTLLAKALPAPSVDEENETAAELAKHLPALGKVAKWPEPPSDAELAESKRKAEQVAERFKS